MKKLTIVLASVSMIAMSGCAVATAGVKKGDERNMARSIDDVSAGRAIKARLSRAYDYEFGKVDVEVAEGIALLTGTVPSEDDRREAERIAWSGPNIVQVGNEIKINNPTDALRDTKDAFIGTQLRGRLMAEKGVKSRNFNIETEDGVVYLLGVARNQEELQKATYLASTTDGVKEVVSYVKVSDGPIGTPAGYISPESFGTITQTSPHTGSSSMTGLDPSIPMLPGSPTPPAASGDAAPDANSNEPFYRDPQTGERIILPPGTKTIPYDPHGSLNEEPYYIDPSNGERIQIVWISE